MRGASNASNMQNMAQAQTNQMMKTMMPKMGPAQFFPECQVLDRISNFPANVCTAKSSNPADVSKMMAYQNMAQMSAVEYERSKLGSIECINNRQKAFNAQLINYQNSLKALQDQLKKDAQIFRDNNAQKLADMKSNFDELNGPGTSIDAKTVDFQKQFSPACRSVIMGKTQTSGLVGLMKDVSNDSEAAAKFSQDRPQYEAEILSEVTKIKDTITSGGFSGLSDPTVISENYRTLVGPALANEQQSYDTKLAKLKKDIGGFDPAQNDTLEHHKNTYMEKCMRGESGYTLNGGIKLNRNTLGQYISQSGINAGTGADGYRSAVADILENPDVNYTLEARLADIQNLEKTTFKNMVFNNIVSGRNNSQSASQAFAKLANECQSFYTSPSASNGPSPAQNAISAQASMLELKNLQAGIGDKVSQALNSKLFHCNGQPKKASEPCNANSMTPGAQGFTCLDTANTCAVNVQGCYAEISAKVGQKTALVKNLGAQYNAAARAMVANANNMLSRQKAAVGTILATIQQKFPGMSFALPADSLFVPDPAMMRGTPDMGIDLVAGGNLDSYLNDLPNKIGNIQALLVTQQEKAKSEIDNYLNGAAPLGLIASLDAQKARWEALGGQCKGMVEGSMQDIAAANLATQEQDKKKMQFCKNYDAFTNNPNPSCGAAQKLTSTISDVISLLPGKTTDLASQLDSTCAETNNAGNVGSTADVASAEAFCGIKGDTSNDELLRKLQNKKISIDMPALVAAANKELETIASSPTAATNPEQKPFDDATTAVEDDTASLAHKRDLQKKVPPTDTAKQEAADTKVYAAQKKLRLSTRNLEKATKLLAKHPAPATDSPAAVNSAPGDPICKRLYAQTKTDSKTDESNSRAKYLQTIVGVALNNSAATSDATSGALNNIMGQMKSTPCTGIAGSSNGKSALLPWQIAPDAGTGAGTGALGK
jgi:hypothetical protein